MEKINNYHMFKKGDILIAKENSISPSVNVNGIHLTTGNQYRINSIEKSSNFILTTFSITDDNGEPWFFFINTKEDDEYYYGNFFYTKKEWRDMRLSTLLEDKKTT